MRKRKFAHVPLAAVIVLMIGAGPALAASGFEWSAESIYDNEVVVKGEGVMKIIFDQASGWRSFQMIVAKDPRVGSDDDGNTVYGVADWFAKKTNCTEYTLGYDDTAYAEVKVTTCGEQEATFRHRVTPETCSGCQPGDDRYRVTTDDWNVPLADAGLYVEGSVCAQMGWPVPDSCSDPEGASQATVNHMASPVNKNQAGS